MITRYLQLAVTMMRPPLLVIFMLFAAIGLAQAGRAEEAHPLLTVCLVVIAGWFVHAAAVNDLADELIDRVNFPRVGRRPLASGEATRREVLIVGLAAGFIALAVAWAIGWRVGAVVTAGITLSAAYSLPPLRLSARGGLAPVILPACYVALPFLVGVLSVQRSLDSNQLMLLAALWVVVIGRILLKDFRDVEGDAMFGKRTFLLRYGRRTTCITSGSCYVTGTGALTLVMPITSPGFVAFALFGGCALYGLYALARPVPQFAESNVISAIAMLGRGMAVTLLAHYSMIDLGHSVSRQILVCALLTTLFAWVSWCIVREAPLPSSSPPAVADKAASAPTT